MDDPRERKRPTRRIRPGFASPVTMPVRRPVKRSLVRFRRIQRNLRQQVAEAPLSTWVRESRERARQSTFEGLSPEAVKYARRNFRLGAANGIIYGLADALIAASFVLALFVNRLGAPNVLVGLIPAILTAGGTLPQLIVATRVQGRSHVLQVYRRTSVVRVGALVLLTGSTLTLSAHPPVLLAMFFISYTIYSLGGGVVGIPWLEVISKTIAPRRRGSFFSTRSFWGGLLALAASGFIGAVLSERLPGLRFPYNFALLFGLATVLIAIALTLMSMVHEPAAVVSAPTVTLGSIVRRGRELMRIDREYRAFLLVRVLLSLATIADPFYVVYAKTDLHAPDGSVGLYLGASSASLLLSNFIWGPLGDRAGNRLLMLLTTVSVSMVPLSALLIPLMSGAIGREGVQAGFAIVFVIGGLAAGSGRIVSNNMLLAIAPDAERATYIGFLNTILGIATFIPPLGGAIVDAVGFVPLFALTLLLAASSVPVSARMSTQRL